MIVSTAQGRSVNFTWLKLLALILMLFDHASVVYLRHVHLDEYSSPFRWPGRVCIPVFAFLVAYGYQNFSRNRFSYACRLSVFALIAEPAYWFCFHDFGNAFIPLALATLFFVAADVEQYVCTWRSVLASWSIFLLAVLLTFWTRSVDVLFVFLLCIVLRIILADGLLRLFPLALALAFFCNWPSLGTLSALLFAFTLIYWASHADFNLPSVRLPKWLAYLFYPAHLLLLGGVQLWFS